MKYQPLKLEKINNDFSVYKTFFVKKRNSTIIIYLKNNFNNYDLGNKSWIKYSLMSKIY